MLRFNPIGTKSAFLKGMGGRLLKISAMAVLFVLGTASLSVPALSEDLSSWDQKRRDKFLLENLAILEQLKDPHQQDSLVAAPERGWFDWVWDLGGVLFTTTPNFLISNIGGAENMSIKPKF